MKDEIDATITGPLNKEALNLAGHHYSGHTEIYAELTGTKHYSRCWPTASCASSQVSTHVSCAKRATDAKKIGFWRSYA